MIKGEIKAALLQSMIEEGLNLKDIPFTSLKTFGIPFFTKTPHNAMWHSPPKGYVLCLPKDPCQAANISMTLFGIAQ